MLEVKERGEEDESDVKAEVGGETWGAGWREVTGVMVGMLRALWRGEGEERREAREGWEREAVGRVKALEPIGVEDEAAVIGEMVGGADWG
jgi:hypothetical protein